MRMMRRLTDDKGQAGYALIIVIAWALSAVLILTRTLVAAQEINSKVTTITSDLASSKHDTSYVALLNQVEPTADQILAAAAPLTGQLATVVTTAQDIQKQVDGITPPVQSINGLVHTIHGQVGSILATAQHIDGTLTSIRANNSSVILTDVVRIKSDTTSIANNVVGIEGDFCALTSGKALIASVALSSAGPPCTYLQTPLTQ